jgi:hypothetical protein
MRPVIFLAAVLLYLEYKCHLWTKIPDKLELKNR